LLLVEVCLRKQLTKRHDAQGPVDGTLPFLESCGFKCPVHKDIGSFMQEVTAPIGQLEFASDALRAEKGLPSTQALAPILQGKVPNTYEGARFTRATRAPSNAAIPHSPVSLAQHAVLGGRGPAQLVAATLWLKALTGSASCAENPVTLREMAQRFWTQNEHGRAMARDLGDNIGARGPPQSLVTTKYALPSLRMLALVCGRQMRLALNQRGMNTGRAVQVCAALVTTLGCDGTGITTPMPQLTHSKIRCVAWQACAHKTDPDCAHTHRTCQAQPRADQSVHPSGAHAGRGDRPHDRHALAAARGVRRERALLLRGLVHGHLFLAMGSIPQQHMVLAAKPVFYKQRDNFFYHGGALLLSASLGILCVAALARVACPVPSC
jgi:hypothetical protein